MTIPRGWIKGSVTVSAAAIVAAIMWAAPRGIAALDLRYANKDSLLAVRAEMAARITKDSSSNATALARIFDALCEMKPALRACHE